jgi:hypothetical protein
LELVGTCSLKRNTLKIKSGTGKGSLEVFLILSSWYLSTFNLTTAAIPSDMK